MLVVAVLLYVLMMDDIYQTSFALRNCFLTNSPLLISKQQLLYIQFSYTMGFSRYVEVGRVVLINYGPDAGKLATVIDIVDQNKCLVEGPEEITGVQRQVISYRRIALTDLTVNIQRSARAKSLKAAWKEGDTLAKWEGSQWAKKLASKKTRAGLSDFDRFKVMVAKKQKSRIIAQKMKELKA